jgi:exodeoxyribonuclease VIII
MSGIITQPQGAWLNGNHDLVDIGIYDYHADFSALSKSMADRLDQSPAHLREYIDNPESRQDTELAIRRLKPTHPLVLGQLFDTYVLEPDLLDLRFLVCDERPKRNTNKGKAEWAELENEAGDRDIVTRAQMADAEHIRKALLAHPKGRQIFSKGSAQDTIYWNDDSTGVRCKARSDWIHAHSIIVDLKSTRDARPDAFAKAIVNYAYDKQSGHYTRGFGIDSFIFVAFEKEPPYGIAIYLADKEIIARGRALIDRNLETWAECLSTNKYPGYPTDIQPIELPRWAKEY